MLRTAVRMEERKGKGGREKPERSRYDGKSFISSDEKQEERIQLFAKKEKEISERQ